MWKASFTSVLAVKKKPPLRNFKFVNLKGLIASGVTTVQCIMRSSASRVIFQEQGTIKDKDRLDK